MKHSRFRHTPYLVFPLGFVAALLVLVFANDALRLSPFWLSLPSLLFVFFSSRHGQKRNFLEYLSQNAVLSEEEFLQLDRLQRFRGIRFLDRVEELAEGQSDEVKCRMTDYVDGSVRAQKLVMTLLAVCLSLLIVWKP